MRVHTTSAIAGRPAVRESALPRGAARARRACTSVAFVALLASVAAGCGARSTVAPPLAAEELAARRVDRALERAGEALWSSAPLRASVRRVDAACACPPWLLRVGDRWVRIALRAERGAGADVVVWLEQGGGEASVWLRATREVEQVGGGWAYAVFDVARVEPPGSGRTTAADDAP